MKKWKPKFLLGSVIFLFSVCVTSTLPLRAEEVAIESEKKKLVAQKEKAEETTEEKEGLKRPVEIEQMTVTATKTPINVQEVPAAVSVVTCEDIKLKAGVDTFYEAIRHIPGLNVTKEHFAGHVTIRGERAAMLINGRDVRPFFGGPDFVGHLFGMGAVERIEVIRGPQSAVHGSKAQSGVINIITKKGDKENPYLEINSFYGTGNHLHGGLNLSGGYKNLSYFISGSGEQLKKWKTPKGTIPYTEYTRENFYSRFDYALTDHHNITLEYTYNESDTSMGANEAMHPLNTYRQMYKSLPDKFDGWTLSYNGDFTDWFSLYANFSIGKQDLGCWYADEGELLEFFNKENKWEWFEDYYWGEIHGTFNILPENRLRVVTGVQHKSSELDWTTLEHYEVINKVDEEETYYAPYLEVEYRPLDYTLLSAGIRRDEYTYDKGSDKEKTSPKIGLSVFPFAHTAYDWTTLWASYSEGFRAPYGYELYAYFVGNPDLEPVETEAWEFGLKQRMGLWANLEFSYFEMDFTDNIYFNPKIFKFDNIGKSKHEGYELLLEFYPYSFLTLYFAYTDLDRTNEITGEEILGQPGQIFSYGLRIEDLYGFCFTVDGSHKSDWMFDKDNEYPAEDKMLLDAKLLYRWHMKENVLFEPFFSVENITDEEYYSGEGYVRLREGRTFHGGLTLTVNF